MNLLEHYILEVISVEDCSTEYDKSVGRVPDRNGRVYPYVKVILKVDCYGVVETVTEYWDIRQWEVIKRRGYYLA